MKTWWMGALLGALALAACGRGTVEGGGGQGTAPASTPAEDPAPEPAIPAVPAPPAAAPPAAEAGDCPHGVTVRIVGTNPGSVSSLLLEPGTAGASCAPAAPVCVSWNHATAPVDVSTDAVARDLFTFTYPPAGFPPDGAPMTLHVEFLGGTATVNGTTGALSRCGHSMSFPFDPARISRDRCAVTILLDVGRSVVEGVPGLFSFVPQYRVFF